MMFLMIIGGRAPAWADQIITGTVVDSSGAVVPEAAVTVSELATGVRTDLRTDGAGLYRSPSLPLGKYSIQVSKAGFQTLVRTELALNLGQTLRVDVTLSVGSPTTTVSVTEAPPLLNTENPSLSGTLESEAVSSLPLRDRTLGDLMETLPGVYYTGSDNVSYGTPRYNVSGTGNVLFSIDGSGMAVQQGRTGNNQLDIAPPVDSIAELRIDENYFGAQYGGHDGALSASPQSQAQTSFMAPFMNTCGTRHWTRGRFLPPHDRRITIIFSEGAWEAPSRRIKCSSL